MKSWVPISLVVVVVVLARPSGGQDRPSGHVLSTILRREADAIHLEHPKAKLFQVAILDFVPADIGVDCSASIHVTSAFLAEGDIRYHEVSGQFSACEGSQKSALHISLRAFRTVPCKPHYGEERTTKSCGGPLDDPESEELHHSVEIPDGSLQKAFRALQEKGVELSYRYDLQIMTAARMASKTEEFEIPDSSKTALFKFRSVKPDVLVVLLRGRQSKDRGEITFALVDAQAASIIDIDNSTPLNLISPASPR